MASNPPDKASYIYNSQLDAFTLYHITNDTHHHSAVGPALPALGHATSGAAGTAISKLLTYPLDLVVTRLQVQRQLKRDGKHAHYTGVLDAINTIYEREGGLAAFYSGVVPEVVKGVGDSFLFFLAYSYVRQSRLNARGESRKSLPALEEIGVGVVAGAFSKFWTTPIQQIVTRKQTASMFASDSSSATTIPPTTNSADIAREIYREKGLQGFWSGYSASLILTLNPSITMLLHKVLLRLLVPYSKRDDPGARLTFLLAAVSKALASTVTYPFSLAKTRAQVSSQKPSSTAGETSEKHVPDTTSARARQRTVFSTIVRIAETEGLGGLYQGLAAEVLKGFFSHGMTMLMKDRIHTLIISVYYSVLKALKKYPSPEELAQKASAGAKELYEQGKEQAGEVYDKGVQIAGQATEKVKEVAAEGSQRASELLESGKTQASNAYAKTSDLSASAAQTVQNATQILESGKGVISDANDKAVGAAQTGRDATGNIGQRVKDAVEQADVRDVDGPEGGVKE
ncbi:mitochondrial carrier domain-containing protein [Paraphoma chrysanthemicola]|uniref:Mitochondrial carrier domain-containing protein n=1 Tax=Paraphoma chrysanthemicola TaxID=798071 RepID=A0A8K0RD21_9PLEO|nr:mitochondrial carrier domain-containing protein [Paraphoma chrysanthemicola]